MPRPNEESRWFPFIQNLRQGLPHKQALDDAGLSTKAFNQLLIDSTRRQLEYEAAKVHSLRASWSMTELDKVMDDIIHRVEEGNLKRILDRYGRSLSDFLRLADKDPIVSTKYIEARKLQASAMIDDLLDAVNSGDDSRSLSKKVDTIKWLMSKLNDDFAAASKASKEVEDSAQLESLLESARKRVERIKPKKEDDDFFKAFGA